MDGELGIITGNVEERVDDEAVKDGVAAVDKRAFESELAIQGGIEGKAKVVDEWYQRVVIVRRGESDHAITCPIVVTTLTVINIILHQLYLSLIPLFLPSPLVHQRIALVKASTFLKELQVPRHIRFHATWCLRAAGSCPPGVLPARLELVIEGALRGMEHNRGEHNAGATCLNSTAMFDRTLPVREFVTRMPKVSSVDSVRSQGVRSRPIIARKYAPHLVHSPQGTPGAKGL
ncbi:hypothetical protein V8E53_013885 [Lactarius tabidus]